MLITRMTKVVVVVSAPTFSDVQLSLHHKIRAPSGHSVFPQKWSEQRVRNSSQSYYGSNGSIVPWCGLYVPGILIIVICLFDRFFFCREWFLNGNILIIIVSIFIILPLAIMKQLGMFSILSSHFFFLHTVCFVAFCQVHFHVLFFLKKKFLLFTVTDFIVDSVIFSSTVLQVTWVTQVASPCPAWCSFSYRWVRRSTQTN